MTSQPLMPLETAQLILRPCPEIDRPDELELKWRAAFSVVSSVIESKSDAEVHTALSARMAEGAEHHIEACVGLLYGMLVIPQADRSHQYMAYLALTARESMHLAASNLRVLVTEKYFKLLEVPRTHLLWATGELARRGAQEADALVALLLRCIIGGNLDSRNLWLADSLLSILTTNMDWVAKNPTLLAHAFFAFARLISDHYKPVHEKLRNAEIAFCFNLLKHHFSALIVIGRDLVRLLQDLARIPQFEDVWRALLNEPASLAPNFGGVLQLLAIPTPKQFLQARLTPEMESQLMFMMREVYLGKQGLYQAWFADHYFPLPENESLVIDIVRYICCVWHPTNSILQSPVIPRWAVLGWLFYGRQDPLIIANIRQALFLDWIGFEPRADSIMNIEPAALLMYHSLQKYSNVTASLVEFLSLLPDTYWPQCREQILSRVRRALSALLERGVLPALDPIFSFPALAQPVQERCRALYGQLLRPGASNQKTPSPLSPSLQPPATASLPPQKSAAPQPPASEPTSVAVPIEVLEDEVDEPLPPAAHQALAAFKESPTTEALETLLALCATERQRPADSELAASIVPALEEDVSAIGFTSAAESVFFPAQAGAKRLAATLAASRDRPSFAVALRSALAASAVFGSSFGFRLLSFIAAPPGGAVQLNQRFETLISSAASSASALSPYVQSLGASPDSRSEAFCADVIACAQQCPAAFALLAPLVFSALREFAAGSLELTRALFTFLGPSAVHSLALLAGSGHINVGDTDTLLRASLSWEALEQEWLWDLFNAQCAFAGPHVAESLALRMLPLLPEEPGAPHSGVRTLLVSLEPTPQLLRSALAAAPRGIATAALTAWETRVGRASLRRAIEGAALSMTDKDAPSPIVSAFLVRLAEWNAACVQRSREGDAVPALIEEDRELSDTLFTLAERRNVIWGVRSDQRRLDAVDCILSGEKAEMSPRKRERQEPAVTGSGNDDGPRRKRLRDGKSDLEVASERSAAAGRKQGAEDEPEEDAEKGQ